MKLLDSLAEFVLMLRQLFAWPWWMTLVWFFLAMSLVCAAALIWLASKGSVPDPEDVAHVEWLREESRRRESQIQEDAQ